MQKNANIITKYVTYVKNQHNMITEKALMDHYWCNKGQTEFCSFY